MTRDLTSTLLIGDDVYEVTYFCERTEMPRTDSHPDDKALFTNITYDILIADISINGENMPFGEGLRTVLEDKLQDYLAEDSARFYND